MEIYTLRDLSFTYPDRDTEALKNINLSIKAGEFVLLCGKSGCGKTTLLRLLKSSLSPFGKLGGEIIYNNRPIADVDDKTQASQIGFVLQSPDNQIVTDKVWHEMAFGLESLGYKTHEIRTRVCEMASFFGIQNWFYEKVTELSGGQKQLLNLASVMVMQPEVLILDEPTSQLDPIAAAEFLKTLKKINDELGTTIILTEHRLEEVFPVSDRVVVIDNGEIIADDTPRDVGRILNELNHDMYDALPTPIRVFGQLEDCKAVPLTIREGKMQLLEYSKEHSADKGLIPKDKEPVKTTPVIEVKGAYFRYEKNLPDVVKGLNLTVNKGEFFAILGGNGTGKTTAVSLISGIHSLQRGKININGCDISKTKNLYDGLIGVLPQNPQTLFAKKTVYLDLLDMTDKNLPESEREKELRRIALLCRIENLLEYHPYDLSGGEQQRTALAMVLLRRPQILILDEPTKGMDAHFKMEFADILMDLKANGVTILMVSHDIEFCAEFADRCAMFFDGSITSAGTPREFFCGNSFYTTSANRMARKLLPNAILADDIIRAFGRKSKPRQKKERGIYTPIQKPKTEKKDKEIKISQMQTSQRESKLTKRTLAALLSILLAIPLTIYFGIYYLDDRKYYFISLLVILEAMLPFCMAFEKRKPRAREIVIISVLCALAVAGRTAFFMLPEFKPVAALVIISGICFGGETGFLVGSITGFVSNFVFGQGPWTPWQMFSFGIIGFVSGVLFKKGFPRKTKVSLSIFGFWVTLILYGGIMNTAAVLMMTTSPSADMLKTAYIMGFPVDLIHALSTAFFLWFIAEPMLDKLERVKIKYGLTVR